MTDEVIYSQGKYIDLDETDAHITGGTVNVTILNPLGSGVNALKVIDYAHHEIHSGTHFIYTDSNQIESGGSVDYLIATPNTTRWAHMMFDLDGSAITQFLLYEDSDRGGSVLQTVGNNNRNSSGTAWVTIHKGINGGTTDGTLIHQYKGGAASAQSRQGISSRNDEEIILKQNSKYVLRVASGTNSNLTNIRLEWYEHTNT